MSGASNYSSNTGNIFGNPSVDGREHPSNSNHRTSVTRDLHEYSRIDERLYVSSSNFQHSDIIDYSVGSHGSYLRNQSSAFEGIFQTASSFSSPTNYAMSSTPIDLSTTGDLSKFPSSNPRYSATRNVPGNSGFFGSSGIEHASNSQNKRSSSEDMSQLLNSLSTATSLKLSISSSIPSPTEELSGTFSIDNRTLAPVSNFQNCATGDSVFNSTFSTAPVNELVTFEGTASKYSRSGDGGRRSPGVFYNNESSQEISKKYYCNTCDMFFTHSSTLKRHLRTHAARRVFPCKDCEKSFTTGTALKMHNNVHNLKICRICNKGFVYTAILMMHQRTHTGGRPYACEHCEKRFKQSLNLNMHKRVHTGERPYKCYQCGESFRHLYQLRQHGRAQH